MWKRFDPSRPLAVIAGAVVAGVLAGLAASVLLSFTAEPVIDRAVALEEARHRAAHPGEEAASEPELVSRSTQRGVGRFAAYGLGGAAYGVLFGIAFLALGRRRSASSAGGAGGGGAEGTFRRALLAGALLAGAFTVMPFVKYPPNPPGVGDPSTLAERQWKYLALIFLSLVVLAGAARLSGRLRERRWREEERLVAVGLAAAVPLGIICAALPPFSDPVDVPANLLWHFRIASLGGNLLLWAVLTVAFGMAAARRQLELSGAGAAAAGNPLRRPATSA
jgi:predicted cobalt transporter CbtA